MLAHVSIAVFLSLVALATSCRNAKLLKSGVDQKESIVQLHNRLRDFVAGGGVQDQPKAQNMLEMVWDDQLALTAQRWADNCEFKHDPEVLSHRLANVGQNLAVLYSSEKSYSNQIEHMIQLWFNEVYDYGYNGTYQSQTGHYSQMVWGNNDKIGCGFSHYFSQQLYHNYLVCNYSPGGNRMGEASPYTYGSVNCDYHNLGRSRTYKNLCSGRKSPGSQSIYSNQVEVDVSTSPNESTTSEEGTTQDETTIFDFTTLFQ